MVKVFNEFKGTMEVTKEFYEIFRECQSKDTARTFMLNIYFDGSKQTFVATDGRRMVYHRDENISSDREGYYELAKIGKKYKLIPIECNYEFVKWGNVIPETEKMVIVKIDGEKSHGLSGKLDKDSPWICKFIKETGCLININYMLNVLKYCPSFTAYFMDINMAILFEIDEQTNYIVMPLQQDA